MTIEELVAKLTAMHGSGGNEVINHLNADGLLLEFIDNEDVTKAFDEIRKWYE